MSPSSNIRPNRTKSKGTTTPFRTDDEAAWR